MMDAITLLTREHDRVRELFGGLAEARDAEQRLESIREIGAELILHAQIEEEFFYGALEKAGDPEAHQVAAEARAAHELVEDLLERLLEMDPRGRDFERSVAELERNAQQHARDEEVRVFPVAERVLGLERLQAVGRDIRDRRARLEDAA
jgi:hemerythrin-like domain-containing protein